MARSSTWSIPSQTQAYTCHSKKTHPIRKYWWGILHVQLGDQRVWHTVRWSMEFRWDWVSHGHRPRRLDCLDGCDYRESMTFIECINGVGSDVPPMLVVTGVQFLALFFNNDLLDNVIVTIFKTGYSNEWISLQWLKHFDKFRSQYQNGGY